MALVNARQQSDDNPVIQSFLQEFSKEPGNLWRIGRSGAANDIKNKYISCKTLQQSLDISRVQELLDALFGDRDEHPPDAGRVTKFFLRTFAILIRIGFGRMILYFIKQQLNDARLPYHSKPTNFPSSSNQLDLFSEFYKEQWGFSAQLMEYDMGYQLEQNTILPITNMEMIYAEGGSAMMYLIEIDEDYNAIRPPDDEDLALVHSHRNTFALKHYRTEEAKKYYETESKAFRQLRYQNRPRPNIIAFYGGFERENSYNIILEYADGGNLDQYMERNPAPTNVSERFDFWNSFVDLFDGIANIHGEGEDSPSDLQILHGWHQDINPTNILVKSRPHAMTPYDCHFKIADLGLSHFKKHIPGLRTATDKDTFGTRAYGAPETHRADLNIAKSNLKVKQDVDIWSMGCVLSEVVTWACQGWNKVVLYRQQRSKEIETLTGQREDRFHQQWQLLQTVGDIHRDNKENCRRNDEFTPRIIGGLVVEMLQVQSKARPNARYLYEKSRRIIDDICESPNHGPSRATLGSLRRMTPTKMPPQLPPHHRREESGESVHSHPSPPIPTSDPAVSSHPLSPGPLYSEAAYGQNSSILPGRPHFVGQSASDGQYPISYAYSNQDQTQVSQRPGYAQASGIAALSQRNVSTYTAELQEDPFMTSPAPRRAETRNLPLNDSKDTAHDSGSSIAAFSANKGGHLESSASKANSNVAGKRPISSGPQPDTGQTELQRPPDWEAPPELLLHDALGLLNKNLPFPDASRWLEGLKGRDHAFLVDNSESSQPFRKDMRNVLKVLAATIRRADPDGPDLYFTGPYRKLQRQSLNAMLNEFDATQVQRLPDMRSCLAQILSGYQDRFGKLNWREKLLNPKDTHLRKPRKFNLYMLTDGIWQPNTDLVREIQTQVAHLCDRKLTDKQIGIQFIRFGKDPQSIRKLRRLDSELGFELDIVDTTPANGNIWKMLHGAINSWFDDDPRVEDNQPGQTY